MNRLPTSPSTLRLWSLVDHTEAEGPGLRFALWTQGCTLGCVDCCNPHLWSERGGTSWTVDDVFARIEMPAETFEFRAFTRLAQIQYLLRTKQIDDRFYWLE